MLPLICRTFETTLASISLAASVPPADLLSALVDFDGSVMETSVDDPAFLLPRIVLAQVEADFDSLSFSTAHYFHGTRTLHPERFSSQGILPLPLIIDQLWADLYELASEDCSPAEWVLFRRSVETDGGGDSGFLYRIKLSDPIHHGPHALLLREPLLRVPRAWHDYLDCPEIVQDIARCYGHGLEARFRSLSTPCIVEFEGPMTSVSDGVSTALWYLFEKVRNDGSGLELGWGPDLGGVAVRPDAVIAVEVDPKP